MRCCGCQPHAVLPCPLRSNLIVLDEVMQHLDGEGCLAWLSC